MEKEVESLKAELERNKREACQAEDQYKDALHHWQTKVMSMKILRCITSRNMIVLLVEICIVMRVITYSV